MNVIQTEVRMVLYARPQALTLVAVPVILIFTKCDALDAIAFTDLEREGKSIEEAEAKAPRRALEDFEKQQLPRFKARTYPPKDVVYLRGMWLFLTQILAMWLIRVL
jgi:hypothetical protein